MTVSPFDRPDPGIWGRGCHRGGRISPARLEGAPTGRRIPILHGSADRETSCSGLQAHARTAQPVPIYSFGWAAQSPLPHDQPASDAMLNEVYNKRIIELAGNIPRLGRLGDADASATAHSKLCGSTVTVDLKMDGDEVTDFAHEVKACALGQASSSIMARNVVGAKAEELRNLRETVRKMLKENGSPPAGKWADIAVLEPVRDYKARHASTMLTFDAVVSALDQIESGSATRRTQAAE